MKKQILDIGRNLSTMTQSILKTKMLIYAFALLPAIVFAQQKRTISLSAQITKDSVKDPDNSPSFTITIRNTSSEVVLTPAKSIISPQSYMHSFINTSVEELASDSSCIGKELTDDDDVAPMRCSECFFGNDGVAYLNKVVKILPEQSYSLTEFIRCYKFKPCVNYRVRFSIDTTKIDAEGQTEWIYFTIPKL